MKKVLSIVLTMALVLTSFSAAFADAPDKGKGLSDIDKSANKEAITVAYDLGIVTGTDKGTFEPTKAVTRAEFAAMITRALAIPESALKASTSSFKDTKGYGWAVPYLAFCNAKGIMLGDGRGNAMPGKTISLNEAVTMSLRAIGYVSHSSELLGTWPANYVTKAQDTGLYEGIPTNLEGLDKQSCAQVIYNLLTVQKVAVDKEGRTEKMFEKDKLGNNHPVTLLTSGLGCKIETAKILDGTEASKINLKPYIGAKVVAYSKNGKIVAIGETLSKFIKGEYVDADKVLKDGDTKYTLPVSGGAVALDPAAVKFKNGVVDASVAFADGKSYVLGVKVDGKTVSEIYSVAVWDANLKQVAPKNVAEWIKAKKIGAHAFKLNDDKSIDMTSFELVGVESLDKIAEGNVLYVYVATVDGKPIITKLEVGTEVVKGQITKIANDKYTINGKEYAKADGIIGGANLTLGSNVVLNLDVNGDIFKADVEKAEIKAGIVSKIEGVAGPWGDVNVTLFTSEGTVKKFKAAKKAKIYTINAANDTVTDATLDEGHPIAGTVFVAEYEVNKDGMITALRYKDSKSDAGVAGAKVKSIKVFEDAGTELVFESNVPVFVYDGADLGGATSLKIVKIDDVNKDAANPLSATAYYVAKEGKVTALVVSKADVGKTDDKKYAVFNDKNQAFADGEAVAELSGYLDGSAWTQALPLEGDFATTFGNIDLTQIRLYSLSLDKNGKPSGIDNVAGVGPDAASGVADEDATDSTIIKLGGKYVAVSAKAVVYFAEMKDGKYAYSPSYVGAIMTNDKVKVYEVNNEKGHEGVDVIIFEK